VGFRSQGTLKGRASLGMQVALERLWQTCDPGLCPPGFWSSNICFVCHLQIFPQVFSSQLFHLLPTIPPSHPVLARPPSGRGKALALLSHFQNRLLFLWGGTGIRIQGLHLELLHHPPFLCDGFFQDRVSQTISPGWLRATFLLISAS
jgi:hypothetical protein